MRKEPIAPRLDSINRNDSSNNLNKKNNKRSNLFKRNPFYSFALSIMCVGLGQIYNSQIIFGLLIFLTTVILIFLRSIENVYLFITLNILILAIWLLSIFHSVIYSIILKQTKLSKLNNSFSYLFFIILAFSIYVYAVKPNQWNSINYDIFRIYNSGMEPSIKNKEYVIWHKNYYKNNNLRRGDIIFYSSKEKETLLTRVIGLPNDTIFLKDGILNINNKNILRTKIDDYSYPNSPNRSVYKENLIDVNYLIFDKEALKGNNSVKFKVANDEIFFLLDDRTNYMGLPSNLMKIKDISHKAVFQFGN